VVAAKRNSAEQIDLYTTTFLLEIVGGDFVEKNEEVSRFDYHYPEDLF